MSHSFSCNSKMKQGQQCLCLLGQTTNATSMYTPCSHIHSLALNHCLSLFYPSKMHGRVDVHISASLHTTHSFLLDQTRHGPNEVHLLLHSEPPSLYHHWYGRWLFGGSPSSSSLLLLSSGKLMIVNVDEKNWNQVFRTVFVCTTKLRTSRERNPVSVHR